MIETLSPVEIIVFEDTVPDGFVKCPEPYETRAAKWADESTPFMGISKVFMDDTHGHFPSQLPWPLEAVREDVDTDTLIFKRTDMEDPNAGIPANSLPPVTPTDSAELLGAK